MSSLPAEPVDAAQRDSVSFQQAGLVRRVADHLTFGEMAKPNYTLAIATDDEGQVVVHADANGLSALIKSLEQLKKKVESGECDHDHFFTDAWAGSELSESLGCEKGIRLIHHLKVYGWTDEWAKKHGFTE